MLHRVKTVNCNGGDAGYIWTNKPPPPPVAKNEIPDDLLCAITFEPMFEAVTCVPCGHTFSKNGLMDHIATQRRENKKFSCPECREYVDPNKIMTAYAIQNMALKYK